MVEHTTAGEIGKARRRTEDNRLIRGAGRYPDDLAPRGTLVAAFVRSPFAHARITRIDTTAAQHAPGVVALLTADDVPAPQPVAIATGPRTGPRESMQTAPGGPGFRGAPAPLLVGDVAHYIGDMVVLVIADSAAHARDAADLVEIDWEPLPSIGDVETAAQPDATLVHPHHGTNHAFTSRTGTSDEELDALFAGAAHVVRRHLKINRLAGVPIQPMTVSAIPEPLGDGITISCTTQAPFRVRTSIATTLGLAETQVRVLVPDIGGGFGVRGPVYSEYTLVALAAHRLRKPVRWIATRSEDLVSTRAARDVVAEAEIAADSDGRLIALRARVLLNLGAYADVPGAGRRILECMAGPYDWRGASVELTGIYTNTTPTGAYRGAGRPEGTYVHERMVDALAMEMGVDPVDLRRRNFIAPDRFPYKTAIGPTYDSGNYGPPLEQALATIDYAATRERQRKLREQDAPTLLGIGIATYVEPTAVGYESGVVRVEPSGSVTAISGSHSHGQGHQTAFAQIVADRLGVPFERIVIRQGDTAVGPPGTGTSGSRSAALGGSALVGASERVLDKAKRIAAHLLEAAVEDVIQQNGGFAVAGVPARTVAWERVARAAYGAGLPPGMEPGLEATAYFQMSNDPWSFGACIAVVSIERQTGEVSVERLVSIDDCGTQINPLLLAGQSHGGLAQGVGAALFEWMQYDAEGQLLTGTLMDYAMPHATDMPHFELGHTVTPSPLNPLGVKGHGESGTIAAPPAVINAVIDALTPLGIQAIDPPLTPLRVWQAMQDA